VNIRRIVMRCKLRKVPLMGLEFAVINTTRHRTSRVLILGSGVSRMADYIRRQLEEGVHDHIIVETTPVLALSDSPSIFHPARMLELHQRFVNEWEPVPRYSKDSPRRDPHGPCTCGRRKRYRNCCGRGRK
jgi:hypothetical protein